MASKLNGQPVFVFVNPLPTVFECMYCRYASTYVLQLTYKVTFPFFNMVELSSQNDLLRTLPQLYDDLSVKCLDTLSDYKASYSFDVLKPTSTVEKHVLGLVCVRAASHLATLRGHEYGFELQEGVSCHATTLHMLDPSKLQYLPTNNLDCERNLAIFNKFASRSASCSNYKFKAKGICDEMTVHKCSTVSVEKATTNLVKILADCERQWVEKQNLLSREKLEQNCSAALKAVEYVHVLLQKCKSWGGPFTNIDKLERCVNPSDNDDALRSDSVQ